MRLGVCAAEIGSDSCQFCAHGFRLSHHNCLNGERGLPAVKTRV